MIALMLFVLQATPATPSAAPRLATFAPCPTPRPRFFAVLTESSTRTLDVPTATQFEVALKSNPSTGYGWRMMASPSANILRFDGRQYVADGSLQRPMPSPSGRPMPLMVGGGGTDLWLFSAMQPGTATLTFTLYPPGTGRPAARTVTFTVRVVPTAVVC